MRRLLFIIWKELLELRMDKRMLPIVFVAPVLQLVVLGYAATTDVKTVPMVVVDDDRSTASRDLIQTFDASPYFTEPTLVDMTRASKDAFKFNLKCVFSPTPEPMPGAETPAETSGT